MSKPFRISLPIVVFVLAVLAADRAWCQYSPVAARRAMQKPDEWFTSDEASKLLGSIISWQTPIGGWAKNYHPDHAHQAGEEFGTWDGEATIDNGFTYTELRLLARAYKLTHRQDVLDAFNRGIDFLLNAQYANGGWPQRMPPPADSYGRCITFNDDAMTNVMYLLKDVVNDPAFDFVDAGRKAKSQQAFDKGVECILNCQVEVNGKLTGWCAQHDPKTLKPANARAYELPSISGDEGAAIAILLMRIDKPNDRVRRAVDAAAAWFAASKITGERVERRPTTAAAQPTRKLDAFVVQDPAASPLWARFYDIETNRPFFCDRDGVKKYSLAEIGEERRAGYNWLGRWGDQVAKEYERWKAKNGESATTQN